MAIVHIESDIHHLAQQVAHRTVELLQVAITNRGHAVWVLSGGTTPLAAYAIIAGKYSAALDWRQVSVVLGDERCVALNHPDSNWVQISDVLLQAIPAAKQLRPSYELSAEAAAEQYCEDLGGLAKNSSGIPQFDVVWLGVGEDGHTLSVFPEHLEALDTTALVVAVHNAPKPPADRITLTPFSLQNTINCLVMTAGANKAKAIAQACAGDNQLPITTVIEAVERGGGQVTWLVDQSAAKRD